MPLRTIKALVRGTSDAALCVDAVGTIVAWNAQAESLFGVSAGEAIGRYCGEVIPSADECGAFCGPNCTILQAARQNRPISNFDLQVRGKQGMRWCNVSVLLVSDGDPESVWSLHIFRDIDFNKRLALSVRDFLLSETALSPQAARALLTSPRGAARHVVLTPRETEVLRLLAGGGSTSIIADRLCLSRATVNNHIQHILEKLNARSRLEAVRRAEMSGLL